jgi:hypothetical protein
VSYSDLLRDPRWQRKRLEVMERDDFTCVTCGVNDKTLNVHHVRYVRGRMPWEYDASELRTLCEDCHKREHPEKAKADLFAPRPKAPLPPGRREVIDRLNTIDSLLPTATDDTRSVLMLEKMHLVDKIRALGVVLWRRYR